MNCIEESEEKTIMERMNEQYGRAEYGWGFIPGIVEDVDTAIPELLSLSATFVSCSQDANPLAGWLRLRPVILLGDHGASHRDVP
jgi:hypothetical protein